MLDPEAGIAAGDFTLDALVDVERPADSHVSVGVGRKLPARGMCFPSIFIERFFAA